MAKAKQLVEVDVWVCVDSQGNHWSSNDEEALLELVNDECSDGIRRIVKITLKLPAPVAIEVAVELPAESQECCVTVT